jgi:negative regulator of sigma E activity
MSDHEFENYLALLSRLLQLSGKHRERIARELRAHLNDRLDDLLAQGVERHEAVRQALEEFGDAAGLAGQFTRISWQRKRRWLMRLTTFSVAAMILLAAGLAIFWPGRNAAPGLAVVIAQAPNADPFATPPAGQEAAPKVAQEAAPEQPKGPQPSADLVIEERLNKTTDLEFVEMPLKDVVAFLQDSHQIPIVLKVKKLDEAGISVDTPMTKQVRGIKLKSALNLILEDLELTYVVRDEVLQITTPQDAQATLEIRIYDCRDILAMPPAADKLEPAGGAPMPGSGFGGGGGFVSERDHRAQQLITIITTNVDPPTWQGNVVNGVMNSASGSVSEFNGLIVVTQTAQTHKKIEHVLDMLREAAGIEPTKARKVVR